MTIEELLEIEAIKQMRYLYSHYYDGNMLDELIGLFTDDAVCEFGEPFGGNWVGKEQIRQRYHDFLYGSGRAVHSQMHAVTNPWIRLTSASEASMATKNGINGRIVSDTPVWATLHPINKSVPTGGVQMPIHRFRTRICQKRTVGTRRIKKRLTATTPSNRMTRVRSWEVLSTSTNSSPPRHAAPRQA